MKEGTRKKIIGYFWVTLTVLIAICTLYVSIVTVSDMVRTNTRRSAVNRHIERLEAKIASDSLFIEQITTSPEFMERFAREHYHMQREGETVYILE